MSRDFLDKMAKKVGIDQSLPRDGRPIKTTVSHARVVYWHYVIQNFGESTGSEILKGLMPVSEKDIFKVEQGIIEDEITNIDVSKSIDSATGTFRITMLATKNWKIKLSPGDWLAIYLISDNDGFGDNFAGNPGTKGMVMLGAIDRVSKTKQRDEESDKVVVRYVISGRDFGRALEDSDIWFNPYVSFKKNRETMLDSAGYRFVGTPADMAESILNLFFGKVGRGSSMLATYGSIPIGGKNVEMKQNYIPRELSNIFSRNLIPSFGSSGVPFNSILKRQIGIDGQLPGVKWRAMLSPGDSAGSVWNLLKRESNSLINNLYVDLIKDDDGNATPTIVLTPHPNSNFFRDTPDELNGRYNRMSDLAQIRIRGSKIKYEDLGRDCNSRINMIWLRPRLTSETNINNLAYLGKDFPDGIGLPMFQVESINRHGIKIYDQTFEFCYSEKESKNASMMIPLYRSFINQIYDLNVYNHLYETGSIVSSGDNRAQLGATLRIENDLGESSQDRLYFIEGYTHTWTFPNQWETEWQLTHGQFDDQQNPFIDIAKEDGGQADSESNRRYLVKTTVKKQSNSELISDIADKIPKKFTI